MDPVDYIYNLKQICNYGACFFLTPIAYRIVIFNALCNMNIYYIRNHTYYTVYYIFVSFSFDYQSRHNFYEQLIACV